MERDGEEGTDVEPDRHVDQSEDPIQDEEGLVATSTIFKVHPYSRHWQWLGYRAFDQRVLIPIKDLLKPLVVVKRIKRQFFVDLCGDLVLFLPQLSVSRGRHLDREDRFQIGVGSILDDGLGNFVALFVLEEEEVVDLTDDLHGQEVHDTLHDGLRSRDDGVVDQSDNDGDGSLSETHRDGPVDVLEEPGVVQGELHLAHSLDDFVDHVHVHHDAGDEAG